MSAAEKRIDDWFQSKGWSAFDFQREVWSAYRCGESGLIHSATGTGKTLAAWLGPLMDGASSTTAPPLTVLWITPMRALSADTRESLLKPVTEMGLPWTVGLRTGDTSASERAKQNRRMPSALITTPESLSLMLSQQDLNEMLNQARRMAQSGSRDSAQQMLDQLQNMLENLQMGMPMPGQGNNGQAQKMLNDLGRMMSQQQQLLQDTFRAQRGQQPGEQPGEGSGEGSGAGPGSSYGGQGAAAQEALRQQLGDLMRRFSNATGSLPQGMGQAEQSMRSAVDALSGQDLDSAAQAQNDALEQMQQGLQQMSQMLREQRTGSRGPGQRDPMDPFGRDYGEDENSGDGPFATDNGTGVPLDSDLERSRQIFEELRQRRNQTDRPKMERDYLDRLLRQF